MEILHPKKIVVFGMMAKMPVAGVVWQTAHYLVGLRRLGYDVYYVEAHGCTPRGLMTGTGDDAWSNAAAFIDRTCRRFGLDGKWAYHARQHDERVHGMSDSQLRELYRDAALIINLHGGTLPLPEHYATGRLVFLETDPVELQVQLHAGDDDAVRYLEPHCAFFTFGEICGRPGCGLPVNDRFAFKPTRQPVVLDFWREAGTSTAGAEPQTFTTVGNWQQPHRHVWFRGDVYHWSKHHEFMKFIDLPARVNHGTQLELALASYDADAERLLRDRGWHVRPAKDLSADADAYRRYVAESRGEFTVAKDQNVRLRSGWFSDRSATYLAAGRPVITQDTGFGRVLPTGRGLFEFSTTDEAVAAIDAVRSDYAGHCRAAADVAHDFFSHDVVLGALMKEVGV